jgi:alkylhydroperoxidase family enzyme
VTSRTLRATVRRVLPVVTLVIAALRAGAGFAVEPVRPLSQEGRPAPSIALGGPVLAAGNANWQAGLNAAAQWIWSANLIPQPFDNNLAHFLLQVPGAFEQQLPFSTTLIFDQASFRNGGQMSGFLDRVTRELVISYVAQRRRSWYSMTHHALLGALTARKQGLTDAQIADKWSHLLDYRSHAAEYSPVELVALRFAEAFATNPKSYTDSDYAELRRTLRDDNRKRFAAEQAWLATLAQARLAQARAMGLGNTPDQALAAATAASGTPAKPPDEAAEERQLNAQAVELATLCMQFVALTDVFTALNIPDEDGLDTQIVANVPAGVIATVNDLNQRGGTDLGTLVPPPVDIPLDAILAGKVRVESAPLRGSRVPMASWETDPTLGTRDKGVAVGALHSGVFGWSNGQYFPGGLGYMLLNHPEMARTEAAYSLPLLFDEDEWRNGSQTAGFNDRRLKELVIQKVYRLTRPRYGIEHHTMFMFNEYARAYAAGAARPADFTDAQAAEATRRATGAFTDAILHIRDHADHPDKFADDRERAILDWAQAAVREPHNAWKAEPAMRTALDQHNRAEVAAGVRRLDRSGVADDDAAYKRLADHQIAELAMMVGHMDGLARALSILHVEGEPAVQIAAGRLEGARLAPTLDGDGFLQITGYFNNRPDLLALLRGIGIPDTVLTANELLLNPALNEKVTQRLAAGETDIRVPASEALATGEF